MKNLLLLGLVLGLISCAHSQSELESLKLKNQELQKEKLELVKALKTQKRKQDFPEVRLNGTETRQIKATNIDQTYLLKIKFPKGYEKDSLRKYPVLYVTDAETNFGGISYIVQRLIKDELIPPILVVGIAYDTDYKNFYRLRSRDLTPAVDNSLVSRDPTGGAPQFCQFLSETLFPYIEKNYRVQADDRALYGHSYGGLFGSYVLLHHSELFQKYLLLSPSLWSADDRLLTEVQKVDLAFEATRLYMASGERERYLKDDQITFIRHLEARKPQGLTYQAEILDNETHRTIFGRGFTNGLRYLYGE